MTSTCEGDLSIKVLVLSALNRGTAISRVTFPSAPAVTAREKNIG